MAKGLHRTNLNVAAERAALAALHLPGARFHPDDPLGELRALVKTAGARVVAELIQRRDRPDPGAFLGKGKLEELKALCDETRATLVVFDNDLTPAQIAAVERVLERKVLDRSELILDIFASRAVTHEAKLQVELAQLEYTYPRLRAMWDHLERIVGVGGVAGIGARGPGEQQLEIDRRIVQRRKTQLKREIERIQARRRRAVAKRKLDHFTVGLVGYTNAGKSTLFNTLTAGGAYADDRLFSTLMTRTRQWRLDRGAAVMLSDTVGFVRDLPHHLIASFRATLEETVHADLLLIVLDVSDPAADLQHETVVRTLDEIFEEAGAGAEAGRSSFAPPQRLLLLNKTDRLRDNRELLVWTSRHPEALPICAIDPEDPGLAELTRRVARLAQGPIRERTLLVPLRDSRTIHELERRAEVLERRYVDASVQLRLRAGDRLLAQLRSQGGLFRVLDGQDHPPAPSDTLPA